MQARNAAHIRAMATMLLHDDVRARGIQKDGEASQACGAINLALAVEDEIERLTAMGILQEPEPHEHGPGCFGGHTPLLRTPPNLRPVK